MSYHVRCTRSGLTAKVGYGNGPDPIEFRPIAEGPTFGLAVVPIGALPTGDSNRKRWERRRACVG
jgi:hypothetical protein